MGEETHLAVGCLRQCPGSPLIIGVNSVHHVSSKRKLASGVAMNQSSQNGTALELVSPTDWDRVFYLMVMLLL